MNPTNIDDFYYVMSEVLCQLYAAFPVRHLLLVEDITGPIRWDMTGMADRKSRACFEGLIWMSEHELLTYRTIEPGEIGIEGAVLTQRAFVLLTGAVSWSHGETSSRIEAMQWARAARAYDDLATIMQNLLRSNCQWGAPVSTSPLVRAAPIALSEDEDEAEFDSALARVSDSLGGDEERH